MRDPKQQVLRLIGLGLATAAAVLGVAALAFAGPVKGGHYSGHLTGVSSETISFKVNSTGTKVTGLKGPEFPPNKCGSGGPPPKQSAGSASISGGKFTATIKYRTATGTVYAKVKVKGKFKKHKKEAGSLRTHFTSPAGASCEKTFTYSTHA